MPYLTPAGWQFPWGGALIPVSHAAYVIWGLVSFTVKVVAFIWFFMLIRWTLPRFRYDQLMHLGWKILFPLSLANLTLTGILVVALK